RAASLENDLRSLESESARWQSVAEKLQATLEERDRQIQGLKAGGPGPTAVPPAGLRPAPKPTAAPRPVPVAPRAPITSNLVAVLDEPGPALTGLAQACSSGGVEARALENGASPKEPPAYTAVNLLATKNGGLEGMLRS